MKTRSKKLDYVKDKIFDLLNDTDEIGIRNIETNDKKGYSRFGFKAEKYLK